MSDQLEFGLPLPSRPLDADRVAILDLIAGDPIHARDREAIVQAILRTARTSAGLVDMNEVRARLVDPRSGELTVYPRVIGAVVSALAQHKVLVADGWIVNQDRKGGNYGKPARRWRLIRSLVTA